MTLPKDHWNEKYVDTVTIKKKNQIQSIKILWPFSKNFLQQVIDPYMTFDPTSVEVTIVTLIKDHCVQLPYGYTSMYADTIQWLFFMYSNQKVKDPKCPLDDI